MPTDLREHLREIIDALADEDLAEARDALSRLAADRGSGSRDAFGKWLVESGLMRRQPHPSVGARAARTERLTIPGEPASKTLVDERR
ncbi:hypothetical protein CMK11_08735 [Candidatus Poribacteria bacterium]|nr:hypothetical protein [Candidatus Poribacteria bacterium]